MLKITELQTRILEALLRYRFLTATQFQTLGLSHSLPVIWRQFRALTAKPAKRPLVGRIDFPARMRVEHVERVHYLTKAGAITLADINGVDFDDYDFTEVKSVYHRDYWHRKYCIDFHIALDQALVTAPWSLELSRFDRYFDKIGANRCQHPAGKLRARTRVDLADGSYLIPDLTFVLQSCANATQKVVYCLEMANGQNTKRVLTQIEKHTVAMRSGAVSRLYGVTRAHTLLVLFEKEGTMQAVERRLSLPPALRPFVLLGSLKEMGGDVLSRWRRGGQKEQVNFVTGKTGH